MGIVGNYPGTDNRHTHGLVWWYRLFVVLGVSLFIGFLKFLLDEIFANLRRYYRTDFFYQKGASVGGIAMPYLRIRW